MQAVSKQLKPFTSPLLATCILYLFLLSLSLLRLLAYKAAESFVATELLI